MIIAPYKTRPSHYPLEKWKEYKRIIGSFEFYKLPPEARQLILEALHNDISWDWWKDCDGCTCVSEPGWPSKYYPPCLRHDYDWHQGHGGWFSNRRFQYLNELYCMEGWRASARFWGVNVGWYGWHKWRNMIWGPPCSWGKKKDK